MNNGVANLLREFDLRQPARIEKVAEIEQALDTEFPESYRAFLGTANGGEGPIGSESYLVLWPIEELVQHNNGYHVDAAYAPDLVFIGTDGGNEVFAFRRSDGTFAAAPLIGTAPEEVHTLGANFQEFLESFP